MNLDRVREECDRASTVVDTLSSLAMMGASVEEMTPHFESLQATVSRLLGEAGLPKSPKPKVKDNA